MPSAKLTNYLHLHLLVFIAGFTAILGELITIDATALVWYRMTIALGLMCIYVLFSKTSLKASPQAILNFSVAGIIIALHWITFFESIKQANISIALSMFSAGAFFTSFIEPIIYKRKLIAYEILFGIAIIIGVAIITQSEFNYINGIILGLFSALFSSLFAVLNGKFLEQHSATKISVYEFISGVVAITIYLLLSGAMQEFSFFNISSADALWLFILASVCTAYAFIAATHVMHYISPYTVVLTYNLEPIYGIVLALILFPESETMSSSFYLGALIILGTVLLNGVFKNRKAAKSKVK